MGRREEEVESGRRHGRHKASPSPTRGEESEEAIRNKLRESGWKKRRTESESTADAEPSKNLDKPKDRVETSSPGTADDRRSYRTSRSSRRARSPRRRDREHRSSRRKSSGTRRRSLSRSRSPTSRSRSRSRSPGRRRRHHSSSSRKRRSSRSPSRSKDVRDSKRSRRASSRSRSMSMSKGKPSLSEGGKKEKEKKVTEKSKKDEEDNGKKDTENEKTEDKKDEKKEKEDRHRPSSSRKSSRRSRSGSPLSPSRSSRRRRHRRTSSYSRSRSSSRSRRGRRGGSRSRSRSPPRDRRTRGRDRDRDRRSHRRGYSRSRSTSYNRRRRNDRSSSRDRPVRDATGSPQPHQHPPAPEAVAPTATGTTPAAPGVNPTITQLMAQYPTMSLQDIIAKMQASNVTMAAAVAQKPARELYVGNLPPNVTGSQLQEFLSTIIQQVGLTTQPGNPIVNTWISTDGHFAFCEMRSVEECNLALLLNQLSLLGQPLKFGRPRSFMGPPQPLPQISARAQTALTNLGCTPNPAWFAQPAVPGITGATTLESLSLAEATSSAVAAAQPAAHAEAGSSHHRLIMSNIPVVLTEDQVKELVEPFGALKSFTLVKDTATGASLGSAVFEYEDKDVAAQAVEGLNGLSIGGILLSVQRQPHTSGAALGALPIAASNLEDQPSAVLKLANMVSIDELRDDEEYADLAEDVEEECKRFGSVIGMEIPRPKDGEEVPGLGCIYVRFGKEEDAVSALKALNGRKFGGNIVKVTYFPVEKFEKNELF